MRSLAALLLATAALATGAATPPTDIRAEYELTNTGVVIGRVEEHFRREGERYSVKSVTRSEGVLKVFHDDQVTLESSGTVSPAGLAPLQFSQRRTRDGRKDVSATFDWKRGVLVSRFRGETREVPLPGGTQDRLSMMYQFMHLERSSSPASMPMSNGRKVERYTYRLVDEARITTPAGEFDTLHYERVRGDPGESRAEVWLAKERFNFPVRVVFDDPKGLRLEQALVALHMR